MQNRKEDQTQRWIEAYADYHGEPKREEPEINEYWDLENISR